MQTDACENFHQRFWEIYLTYSLLGARVQLVERGFRRLKKVGPDLLARVDGENFWIEAVAPTAGIADDAVMTSGPSRGPKPFPEKEIMLRFQQALSTKISAHAKYVEKGWVSPAEGYIVALNGALAEKGYPCLQKFPRIVSALLLGLETETVVLEYDLAEASCRIGGSRYEYQKELEKKSTRTVDVAALRDCANSCVSAVLYSASGAYNCSAMNSVKSHDYNVMAREFVLVLNPHAQVPLPPGFLSAIPRYWVELHDDRLTLHLPTHAES